LLLTSMQKHCETVWNSFAVSKTFCFAGSKQVIEAKGLV